MLIYCHWTYIVKFLCVRHFSEIWTYRKMVRKSNSSSWGEQNKIYLKYMAYQIGLILCRKIKQSKEDEGTGSCDLTVCYFHTIWNNQRIDTCGAKLPDFCKNNLTSSSIPYKIFLSFNRRWQFKRVTCSVFVSEALCWLLWAESNSRAPANFQTGKNLGKGDF